MSEAFRTFATLDLDSTRFDSGLKGAAQKLGTGLAKAAKVGAAAIAAATTAVVAFGVSSVKTGMQFDTAMSQVAATMGYTLEELNTEGSAAAQTMQQLSEFAQRMGSTTVFSANESAQALNYMALAGYDAQTAMKMLPNVLNLAAAGSIDLAYASDMITDSQTALGLSLDETNTLVDQMAKTASTSNTSVSQLGEAILTIGGTAQFMAGGTEQLNKVLGVLADNGIKGAEAGTHLRNMLLSLSAPSKDAQKTLAQLGVDIFDASGNMRDFADIFPELNAAMSTLTDQQRVDALSQIFNARDVAAATALMGTNVDRWNELGMAIETAGGAAEEMAKVQLDNLQGDITLFQSALEGAKIAVSEQLTPSLREMVQFGSSAIGTLTEAFKGGGLEGAMSALGTILSDGLSMIVRELPSFVKAGMNLLTQLVGGIQQNLPMITKAALDIARMLIKEIPTFLKIGLEIALSLIQGITENASEIISTLVDVVLEIADFLTQPSTIVSLINAGIELILALQQGLYDAYPRIIEKLPELVQNIVDALIEAMPLLIDGAIQFFMAMVEAIPVVVDALIEALPQILETIINGLATLGEMLWSDVLQPALQAVWDWIADLGKSALEAGETFLNNVVQFFQDLPYNLGLWLGTAIGKIVQWVSDVASKAVQAGSQFLTNVINFVKELPGNIWNWLTQVIGKITQWAKDFPAKAKQGASDAATAIVNGIKNLPNQVVTIGKNIVEGLWNGIKNSTKWITDKVKEFAKGILDGIKKALGISSPSREAAWVGKMFDSGFAKGLADNLQMVKGAAANVAGIASDTLEAGMSDVLGDVNGEFGINGGVGTSPVYDFGGVSITVNGANYANEQELARAIARELQDMTDRRAAVFA